MEDVSRKMHVTMRLVVAGGSPKTDVAFLMSSVASSGNDVRGLGVAGRKQCRLGGGRPDCVASCLIVCGRHWLGHGESG